MDLGDFEVFFSVLSAKAHAAAPELVRRVAVAELGYARNFTPPNPGGTKDPGAAPVRKLRERIRTGVMVGGALPSAVPSNEKGGARPLAVRGATGWGNYGFVVPRGSTKGRKVRYEDPGAILARRRWKRVGNYQKAWRGGAFEWHWVRKADVAAWVKERERRAGNLLGGWLSAAHTLAMSSRGAFARATGKKTAAGEAKFYMEKGRCRFWAEAWPRYHSIVFDRYVKRFYVYVPRYAQGAVKNVKHWYLKSLGFSKTGFEPIKNARKKRR